jgi:NAD(P)-dependent dehydrogenase (short-subunit alcohol dehydrogenase family)
MSKTVIITGAQGGIGKALSEIYSEAGYEVLGIDLFLNESKQKAIFNIDLARFSIDASYRQESLQRLEGAFEQLHVLVNNAAVQILSDIDDLSIEDWNQTLSVNLTAPMLLSQWAVPHLEKNKGCIVNIASIHQQLTKPRFVAYATSKSALVGLTKSMAVDLAGRVRVNAVSPAAIETDMLKAGFDNDQSALDELRKLHPAQRIGMPEEVAKLALFLSSNEASFINGANLALDGGISSVLNDL